MAHIRPALLYLFLALPVGYLVVLIGFPVVYNLIMSVQEVTIGNIVDFWRPFVGLKNYQQVLADPAFR